jgi:hypothetical protein
LLRGDNGWESCRIRFSSENLSQNIRRENTAHHKFPNRISGLNAISTKENIYKIIC